MKKPTKNQLIIRHNKELGKKHKQEKKLSYLLLTLYKKILSDLVDQYRKAKTGVNAFNYASNFTNTLLKSYNETGKLFSTGIIKPLSLDGPQKKAVNKKTDDDFKLQSTKEIAIVIPLILETLQKDINNAIHHAVNKKSQIKEISKYFNSISRSRIQNISTTETQKSAELKKEVEALSLQNLEYYVARKTWVTILDGRERAWHGDVFGQTVQSGELFIVKDQLLSRPGDISHGATADNVCNCRCSAIYY